MTAYVDPALIALAEDFAAVALEKKHTQFSYTNVTMNGNELIVLLKYVEEGAPHSFNVFINTETWERRHVPSE